MPTKLKTNQDFREGYEKGRAEIIDELKEIIQLNTMSRYFTKEDLYKSVYEKICEYLNEQLKEQKGE